MVPPVKYLISTAIVEGPYRYKLVRTWGPALPLGFIMMNPSTADSRADDPTIRRCVGFAAREHAGGIIVTNLLPWRATDPRALREAMRAGHDVSSAPENQRYIAGMIGSCSRVVAAWGALSALSWTVDEAKQMIGDGGAPICAALWCFGVTKEGHPRHPLMVRRDQPLERWGA